ncbi:MAG: Inner membrane protein YbhL [Desulfovibrio sp.]
MFENFRQPDVVSSSRAEVTNAFMRGVYLWMAAGLAVTALFAYGVLGFSPLFNLFFVETARGFAVNKPVFYGVMIAEVLLVIALSAAINKLSGMAATAMFMLYSALNGMTLSLILLVYTQQSVLAAFLSAAGMFGAMSVYGLVTKRDLTSMGSFMTMGLFGIVIAMVVNLFLGSSLMSMVISAIGVIVFLGLTAYDTQALRNMGESAPMDDATAIRRGTIMGALKLYLDFINIFLMLLRLFGDRR